MVSIADCGGEGGGGTTFQRPAPPGWMVVSEAVIAYFLHEAQTTYSRVEPPITVYRVHGGEASQFGASWTPYDPRQIEAQHGPGSYRHMAGLPDDNWGTLLTQADLQATAADDIMAGRIYSRPALDMPSPWLGYTLSGGMAEIVIPFGCNNPDLVCQGPVDLNPNL